ncbi:MAG: multidrug ABC transporter ATP-binding protein, partial [Thermoguttaceae bacterium]
IGVIGDNEGAAKLLDESSLVESVELREGKIFVTLAENVDDYSELATMLVEAGYKLKLFKEDEINLETAFMALTKGITA